MIQFGLDTFGDVTVDESGAPLSDAQTLRNLVDQAVLADELGIRYILFNHGVRRQRFDGVTLDPIPAAAAGKFEQFDRRRTDVDPE